MTIIKEFSAGKLKIKVFKSRTDLGIEAACEAAVKIKELLSEKEEVNIIFAAAPSQNEFLSALKDYEDIEWERINAFHMDEYIGFSSDSPQKFGNFLNTRLFGRLNFKSVNYINSCAANVEEECIRYSELLKQYPTDIVCMGIGENGHIAFNDPHVAVFNDQKLVKVVELDEKCRKQQVNDGSFNNLDDVPRIAMTLTIPALMSGKYIYCMVPAISKAEAVYKTIFGEISESCPASILRTHDNATLFIDSDSGSKVI